MLDVDESGVGLAEAVAAARAVGVQENLLATGEIAMALVAKDSHRIDELLARHDADRGRSLSAVAFYELTAAAALERRGDPRAVERYQAAVRADPALARGVNVWKGRVVHAAVAHALGMTTIPLEAGLDKEVS